MNCENSQLFPFQTIFSTDQISKVSFNITQTFNSTNGLVVFNHTDFTYKIDYKSRNGKSEERNYSIKTNAILYAYDYGNGFILPMFGSNDYVIGDYRKISAMPYNDFFWKFNDEYKLNDSLKSDERFFSDSLSFTNKTLFKPNSISQQGLFENPFICWSKNRIKFREIVSDTSVNSLSMKLKSEKYKLEVNVFLDISTYLDSTNIITSTIIDPYKSFYHLPIDNQTLCFINLDFDLCEIARRKLEETLKASRANIYQLKEIYNIFLTQLERDRNEYFKTVERGTKEMEMIKYNKLVYEQLGIDNIGLFQPYKSEK